MKVAQRPLRRRSLFAAAMALLVLGSFVIPTSSANADASATGGSGLFVPLVGRLMDTRSGLGGYSTPMVANTWRSVQTTGQIGIPSSGVSAIVATFTALNPTTRGDMNGGPDGWTIPTTIMVYDGNGQGVTSNDAIIAVGSDGKIAVMTQTATDLIIDVQGYYTSGSATAPGGYVPMAQTRIVDTRSGLGAPQATLAGGHSLNIQVSGSGGVPNGTAAVFVNITILDTSTTGGYITPYPTGITRPGTSMNFPGGTAPTAMAAQVALSSSGSMTIALSGAPAVNLLVDVEGYFTPGSTSGSFTPAGGRVFDSRVSPQTAVAPGATITVPVGGVSGVPTTGDGLAAAVVDITVLDTAATGTSGGWARTWADGTTEPTTISSINFTGGIKTNLATASVGTDGAIEIHNVSPDVVNLVVDLEGWYTSPSTSLCAGDAVSIVHFGSAGAANGDPVLSGVVMNVRGALVNGEIYVADASGNPIGGSPTALATVDSGTALTFHVPASALTVGATYKWWIHAYVDDACASQATSPVQSFTQGSPPAAPSTGPGPNSIAITGTQLAVSSAQKEVQPVQVQHAR
jgi:hypothetical protein